MHIQAVALIAVILGPNDWVATEHVQRLSQELKAFVSLQFMWCVVDVVWSCDGVYFMGMWLFVT